MTQHIKYPEEVKMEAIERLLEKQNRDIKETIRNAWKTILFQSCFAESPFFERVIKNGS